MPGTIRTQAALLAGVPVGGPAAGITPVNVEDIIVSSVNVLDVYDDSANAGGLGAPAILRGTVSMKSVSTNADGSISYGAGKTLAVRQANARILQAATDYAVNNNKFIWIDQGIYEIDSTTGLLWTPAQNANYAQNLVVRGAKEASTIIQYHVNAPTLTIGDTGVSSTPIEGADIQGLKLDTGVSQSGHALGNVLNVGQMWISTLDMIQLGGTATANILLNINNTNPAGLLFFSNTISNIQGTNSSQSAILFGAQGTGNVFSNCHFQNDLGSGATACVLPFDFSNSQTMQECVLDQFNLEFYQCAQLMSLNSSSLTFISAHFEGTVLTGASPVMINVQNASQVMFIGCSLIDNVINSTKASGTPSFFTIFDQSTIKYTGGVIASNNPALALNMQFTLFTPSSGYPGFGADCQFEMDGVSLFNMNGFLSVDSNLPRATMGDPRLLTGYRWSPVTSRMQRSNLWNPATGFTVYGCMGNETIVNYDSILAGAKTITLSANLKASGSTIKRPVGDRCTVIRDGNAVGAFNITVINGGVGAGTIGTFTGAGSAGSLLSFWFDGTNWAAMT